MASGKGRDRGRAVLAGTTLRRTELPDQYTFTLNTLTRKENHVFKVGKLIKKTRKKAKS